MMKRLSIGLALLAALLLTTALLVKARWGPNVETVVASSLQGLKEQNRLSAFAARFVTVVTSQQSRFGLSAKKTLILPGMVRYEVDLAQLEQDDLRWDGTTKTLNILLPPVQIAGPEIDMRAIREYDSGGILMALTDAETVLDRANRTRGQEELLKQAQEPLPMKLARDATARAVERSFAMPLRAAGIEAKVQVEYQK
jgi:ABC-type amino acid transport substrate-binding protein